ncbi:acetate kinase [Leptotrichia sp. OH3620_COT-345]|uniref:acetate/propionate family kinase n=1 Tax=Leptotrichia sp. OH3620_COT-345 TaxID=2491048 RepID=UPI000F64630F|nr:acetate kinase [Leptotrichia sp. OH3620_COT-345]RRD39173.1 acetate kinase [Leptotrichia sp. OH3620_COT-345]
MKILVINSGSSSLKFELIDMTNEKTISKGICERVGIANPIFTYKNLGKDIKIDKQEAPMKDHSAAIDLVLKTLQDKEIGVISNVDEIDAIGHRVVHGGEYYDDSVIIDEEVIKNLEEVSALAPLHNPANIMGIKVMKKLLPEKKNVAVFDTAFHQTMKPEAYMYPLPYEDYTELKVRKYGFHGTSHKYVSEVTAKLLGKENSKIIVCHLGNGASISAVKDGKVVDTSMGMTPLAGIMMGTRTGDIDPAASLYVMEKRGLSIKEIDTRMNKKSGILGIFGESSDFRDLENAMKAGNERAKLAYDMFCYRVKFYIGAYAAAMDGVDAIAFTGGIGENGSDPRATICEGLSYLGVKFDFEKNGIRTSGNVELSMPDSKIKVYKIETAEELVIARDTYRLTK